MCGCGGVVEAIIVSYAIKKVYDMSKNKSSSCKVCHCVSIPDQEICPECLVNITEDLDTLEPDESEFITTEDLPAECVLDERMLYDN